ncbi:MAG TPA: hypothetical protein PK798_10800 [Flavobacteriales bacterium]|nr:hypothetical protein [Flavobacteriales bacterium]HRJ36963.1 hypothetical protein [Flavobacteriales bacterium]HRJ39269.1 hypothetical protein [Flavobacteriales bacterium]
MKKLIRLFSAFALVISTGNVQSQAVDQFTALQSIGEGSVFQSYWGLQFEGGKTSGQLDKTKRELKFELDVPERGNAFKMVDQVTKKEEINSGFGWLEGNHLTKPSLYSGNQHAFAYINGLMYYLKGIKDPQNITSFQIERIYVLMTPIKGDHLSGKNAVKEMKTRDHEAVLKKYFSDMKVIQQQATENFTEEEKNKLLMIEQAKKDKKAGNQAKNAAYWNSEEGQRKLSEMRQPDVILVNDTPAPLYLCHGSGAYTELKPGEKKSFSCLGGKVYRGTLRANNSSQYDATSNLLLDLDGKSCGRVVNASTVVR